MKHLIILLFITLINASSYSQNKMWSCINEDGNTVFTLEARRIREFKNGLAVVYKNTLVNNQWVSGYGYVNTKGEIVIPCNLDKAEDFTGEVTWVKRKNEDFYRLIDRNGNEIPSKKYKKVGTFFASDTERSAVYEDGKMGFIDNTGREIIPCKYVGSASFTEGLAFVSLADKTTRTYGFINRDGELVIPFQYKQSGTTTFRNGLARVTVNGRTVLIDKTGKVVFKTNKGNIQGTHGNMVSVFTKSDRSNWGWLNFDNEFVIEPIYDGAINFNSDGYATVEKNDLKGLIDIKGNIVLPIKYHSIYRDISNDGFICGVYPDVKTTSLANSTKDYFNKDLKPISFENIKYLQSANGSNRILFSNTEGTKGYMDRNYNVVIPAVYKNAEVFSEGLAWVLK